MAERLVSIFLEIVVAPAFDAGGARGPRHASPTCASSSTRRSRDDEPRRPPRRPDRLDPDRRWRGPRHAPDIAATTRRAGRAPRRRPPTDAEQLDLDLAWRLVRGVTSNAIVLVRDRRLVGMGSGQTSRVDAARQAVAKAHAMLGPDATVGRGLRSDAFFPFPDAVEVCLAAGVTAFVQPGGSIRDADVVAAVEAAGGDDAHHRHPPLPPLIPPRPGLSSR